MSSARAEREVVGACITSPERLAQVRGWLLPEHFEDKWLGTLYGHALSLKPDQIDPVTIAETAAAVGFDPSEVIELSAGAYFFGSTACHAELIVAAAKCRDLREIGQQLGDVAYSQGAEAAATWAQAKINAVCVSSSRAGPVSAKEGLREWHREFMQRASAGMEVTGLVTPWAEVNAITKGLQPGRFYVIAGRPGMGKSVFGENLATFNGLQGGHPLVFSLEMSRAEWWQRAIAQLGRVDHEYLQSPAGVFEDADLYADRVAAVVPRLTETSVEIDEEPSLTLQQIEARAERAHMRRALSMVVVDHIHIMGRPRKNDVSELGEISAGLKRLAKRLHVPVVGLAQLNRANTDRTNKRPTMADLRGSGDIEQDADVILLAHREDYYRQQGEPRDHLLELIVAKQRGGKSGMTINLRERFDQMRADDWDGMLPEREAPKVGGKKLARAA